MDVATMKKDLENQIGSINEDLKNIYLPLEAVLILLGERTAFGIALELIDSLYQEMWKPAEWSEEDECMLKEIIAFFKDGTVKLQHDLDLYAGWLANRLKSLRPHWKPSEKQIEALEKIRNIFHVHHLWDEINPILYDYEELMRDLQELM